MFMKEDGIVKWENLTADQLHDAVETSKRTVLLPVSITEKHGHHLPLGTDTFINRVIIEKAEKLQPFVVAPEITFGQGSETMNGQGTIAIPVEISLSLLEAVCDELYRNGFEKILIADGHGGNQRLLPAFSQSMLQKGKPYVVYYVNTWFMTDEEEKALGEKYGWDDDPGHADRDETALVMRSDEELVHMDRYDAAEPHYFKGFEWMGQNGIFSAVHWPLERFTHVTGRPDLASVELGDALCSIHARHLARQIRLIQEDDGVLEGYRRFLAEMHFEK